MNRAMRTATRRHLLSFPITLLFLLQGQGILAQEPIPVGPQFQLNTETSSHQFQPSVGVDAEGNFVAVWQNTSYTGADTSFRGIVGQRYNANGTRAGVQFQVNTYTTGEQINTKVASGPDGDFVVVWQSNGSFGTDTFGSSVQGQRYNPNGTPEGGQFQVNSYEHGFQQAPAVAADAQGSFVVVWESNLGDGTDTSYTSIQAQRYDANGAPVGEQFQVNSYTTYSQLRAAVAVEPDGDFVVVWDGLGSYDNDTSNRSVNGQRFDAQGMPVGAEFQVNTYTTSGQSSPAVATDSSGNFVVVWESYGSNGMDTSYNSIQGQRYDADGASVGSEFLVNSYTTNAQDRPGVAMVAQDDFTVVWDSHGSYGTDTSSTSVQMQFYDGSGAAVGEQFQINSYTTSGQYRAAVAANAQGNFVVVWDSNGSYDPDSGYLSIQGQRFSPLFANGSESGDFSGWSSVFPPPGP